jgi:hypothetical protein
MDVEKLLRLVVNFVALVVLAVATAVALVVAARGDAGVGSRAPTVSPRLVSERSLALDRGSRDPAPVAEAADRTPRAKPKARPPVRRKVAHAAESEATPTAQPELAARVELDDGSTEPVHEEEEHGDEEGGRDEEGHGDEGWEGDGDEGSEGDDSDD